MVEDVSGITYQTDNEFSTNLGQILHLQSPPPVCAYLIAIGEQVLHYVMDGGAA